MAKATRGLSPDKQESRRASSAQRLPVICQLGGDDIGNSTKAAQLQFLRLKIGLPYSRAHLISALAFGEAS